MEEESGHARYDLYCKYVVDVCMSPSATNKQTVAGLHATTYSATYPTAVA